MKNGILIALSIISSPGFVGVVDKIFYRFGYDGPEQADGDGEIDKFSVGIWSDADLESDVMSHYWLVSLPVNDREN